MISVESSLQGQCEHLRQTVGVDEAPMNPIQSVSDIVQGFILSAKCYGEIFSNSTDYKQYGNNVPLQMGAKFVNDLQIATSNIRASEIVTAVILAIIWTFSRLFLTNFVFRPFAKWVGVRPKNVEKMCESAWKALAYFVMWSYACRVLFFHDYDYFSRPMQMFRNWSMATPPSDLTLIYAMEFSFYLHCVYGTIYMDAWRKDSMVMLTHHFVAMTLISVSYMVRCLMVGLLIFALNDIADILLEGGKVATYLRQRTTGFSKIFSIVSDITAALFAASWFVNRLIFHLTKVWRGSVFGFWAYHPLLPMPFVLFLNVFLGLLYLLYLYWFWFIIIFIVRLLFGKGSLAEDPREDEDANKVSSRRNTECDDTPPLITGKGMNGKPYRKLD